MLTLLEPIRYVHSLTPPIVHRDLKPANVLVERRKGGKFRLRVADFGISDVAAREALRDTDGQSLMTVGVGGFTALYASPQQVTNEPADPRDDVHALGVIWLQMLTGDMNKGRPSGSSWKHSLRNRGMSESMLTLLEQCMDDAPPARPRDASEFTEQLKKVLGNQLAAPPPPSLKKVELPRTIINSIGMTLVLIPAGTFIMGSPEGEGSTDEHPQHEVEITLPFYLSAFQVTQEEFHRVLGNNPSHFCVTGAGKDKVKGLNTTLLANLDSC